MKNQSISPPTNLDPSQWVQNYGEYLLHYALGKVRDHAIAEDLVQETLMAAWKARSRFQGRAQERTWLTRILLNKIADHYRSAARKPRVLQSDIGEAEGSQDALDALAFAQTGSQDPQKKSPARAAEHAEFVQLVEDALTHLPEQAADAFRMREIQGLSTEDIVSKLDITPNHLWVLIHRAKKAIRNQLESIWDLAPMPIPAV